VGFVPQEVALYEELSANDNLHFFGSLYGYSGNDLKARIHRVLMHVGLLRNAHQPLKTFSGGMLRKVNLACAMLHHPLVLLLDEPTVALDPQTRDILFATLQHLREFGYSVVLTTHQLEDAEIFCDRIGILRTGKLQGVGRPNELLKPLVQNALLYGHLKHRVPERWCEDMRQRMPPEVELELTGRRVRLSAPDSERLGLALATLLSEGVEFETFRTPPARLERLFRDLGSHDSAPVLKIEH
jgi:ABC-2 type transport system ATP-binding protein